MNKIPLVSVIVPTNKDPYIQRTIDSLLSSARCEIEILVCLDNYIPDPPLKSDPKVKIISSSKILGERSAFNAGLAASRGKFIMKSDCHCLFGEGFDKILSENCKRNWVVIPRRYPLNEVKWQRGFGSPMDYHFLTFPKNMRIYGTCMTVQVWNERRFFRGDPKYDIDDTLTFQGSCFLANKNYFMKHVGFLNDSGNTYGPFVDDQIEIGMKYWLGGGQVKVVKSAWYAHLSKRPHHYKTGVYSKKFKIGGYAKHFRQWSSKHWMGNEEPGMIHPFSWIIEKFWPVPGWPEDRSLWAYPEKSATIQSMNNMEYKLTPLCELAVKYNSDKCPRVGHCYTPIYHQLFGKRRKTVKKVLEIQSTSLGTNNLQMWRDYFPNAIIYGAGNFPFNSFRDNRILTYYCDEKNKNDIENLIAAIGNDFDLVVDCASRHISDQFFLFDTLMPLLNKGVTYVIENCMRTRQMRRIFPQYNSELPIMLPNGNPVKDGFMVFKYKDKNSLKLNKIKEDMRKTRWRKSKNIWEPFMTKYKCDVICEIGVRSGMNFLDMIQHNPKVAVAIDSWIDDGNVGTNDFGYAQEILDKQYEDFKKMVADKKSVQIYREYSYDAVKRFPDNYFDLVYIDADHSYEGCLRDINDWYPKVKKGKFLFGDDYRNYENKIPLRRHLRIKFGVIQAVNEFARKNNLEFFILPQYGWGIIKK